ncbi:hypothetical protein [Mariniblastus fucicola]|uniref:Uncharacterized protein n=1 Tax=Mariniblastus fucicola TaxID=980251 RepID=A0A5B9P298_9BACT|nr:hypothetical protein [Mariniblastus fucicola]QEG20637.1 hypothetical protein MFFC18_04870 [Mariniblastus fucicola]
MSIITRPIDRVESKTSAYDRLSAWLTALITLVGFLVTMLFLIWLTSVFKFERNVAPPFVPATIGEDGNDKPEGFEDDELDPGVEDFAEVDTPQLAEALEAVSNAVSTIRANSEHVSGDAAVMGKGGGYGSREGGPSGSGDGIPDYKRWKIVYEVDNKDTYKDQLDYFNIQIGVIPAVGETVYRISNVSKRGQVTQTSREKEKKSLLFSHAKLRMKKWDQEIAASLNIDTSGATMAQFYDQQTRFTIAKAEDDYLKSVDRELKEVRRTNIRVEADGGGFKFTIVNCEFQ